MSSLEPTRSYFANPLFLLSRKIQNGPFPRKTCSLQMEWWSAPAWGENKDNKQMMKYNPREKGEIILNDWPWWVGKVLIIGWNIFQKFWCVHRTLGWYFQSFSIPAHHIIIISYCKLNYHKTLGWYFPFSAENFKTIFLTKML